jgi:hypothetical protein
MGSGSSLCPAKRTAVDSAWSGFGSPSQSRARKHIAKQWVRSPLGYRIVCLPASDKHPNGMRLAARILAACLLGKLVDGGLGETSTDLSGARWEAPGAGIPALGEQYVAVVRSRAIIAPGIRTNSEPTTWRSFQRYEPMKAMFGEESHAGHRRGFRPMVIASTSVLCHNRATVMPQNNRIQPEPIGLGFGFAGSLQTALASRI